MWIKNEIFKMHVSRKYFLHLFFCVLIFFCSCVSSRKISKEDFSGDYRSVENFLAPQIAIFHSDSLFSKLIFQVPSKSLLFEKDSDLFTARVSISYELHSNYSENSMLATKSKLITINAIDTSEKIKDTLVFPMEIGNINIIKIDIRDVNRKTDVSHVLKVNKQSNFTRQNFLLVDEDSTILFRNYINLNERFNLISSNKEVKKYFVNCYFRNFPLATPPFKITEIPIFNLRPDSNFTVLASDISKLNLNKYGFYHFRSDSLVKDGFTIFQYCSDFPLITNYDQMIEPTRYLTSNIEFKELLAAKDKRAAIDNFWINTAGNKDRAKELIRTYYGRVQFTDKKFSSYLEGWKTDRGLIYIIFGPPSSVYKDDQIESWTYTNQLNVPDIVFDFKRIVNPFTDNDYSLIRQPTYDNPYFMAVDQWRQGRIVNDK